MSQNNIKIAIIDDGVCENIYDISHMKCRIEITQELEIAEHVDCNEKQPNHGTTCAAIIHKYVPEAPLVSVKILNQQKRGIKEQLIKAIEWCTENDIKIINMSLGTVQQNDSCELRKTVNSAVKKGVVIVAACSNRRIITYPSSFTDVIGVKTDLTGNLKEGEYLYNYHPNDGIDITGCSVFSLGQYDGKMQYSNICNSYATPFITAKVYDIVKENPSITIDGIREELMKGSVNKTEKTKRSYLFKSIDWMENAILLNLGNSKIPFPKENGNYKVVDEIKMECDCYCSGAENIRAIFDTRKNQFSQADTFIVNANGFTSKHAGCSSEALLQEIISRDKNVVYLDDREIAKELDLSISNKKIRIWHPSIFNYLDTPVLRDLDVPIICINDFTGSRLMEFTHELLGQFRNNEYNAIAASDTCVGNLFEMNYSPLFSCAILNEHDPAGLKSLCGLYNPNLIIYGIDASSKGIDYSKYMNKPFEVDIEIAIFDDSSTECKRFIDFCMEKKTQLILLTPGNTFDCKKLLAGGNIRLFDLTGNSSAREVYSYIVDLYNKDEEF